LPLQRYYEEPVTWTTTISVPKDAQAGQYKIEGLVGYQVCSGSACDMPQGARFEGTITVGNAEAAGDVPLVLGEARYGEVAKVAAAQTPPEQASGKAAAPAPVESQVVEIAGTKFDSLAMVLGAALVGGFILNFMPCVLPVIGLKILSFAEQAGRSRGHVLTLNLWYSAGLMSVFLVLATLAAGASLGLRDENLGWGEQFSSTTFNIVMACVVFVMALSFLGVWEIPIPGFVGTGAAANAAAQEGAAGAFAKGALSTVLATPCSGPLLGPVFAYTLKQPPAMTYLLFVFVGLGMAAPYLAIGAFPQLIRFLPKPGAWMDSFKHMMGFVLLGTIVFLFTIIDPDYLVPTFALMVALWAACWWIGRISLVRPFSERSAAWIQGLAFAGIVGTLSFHFLTPHDAIIPWKPFSAAEATRLADEGNTVLVDFTANWCLTCKANLKFAIETEAVMRAIEDNKVVPMLADWTDGSAEIKDALAKLNSNSIPVLAIYPAGKSRSPMVLRDVITQGQVLEAIEKAGPSKPAENLTASKVQ
jgi:thiol:disulfide interchange protein